MASEETQRIIAEACAAADRACEQSSKYEIQQRSASHELVYKRHDDALVQPQQQQVTAMDDATAKSWNDWWDGRIEGYRKSTLTPALVEFVCTYTNNHLKVWSEEIIKVTAKDANGLDDKIASLRAEVDALRAQVEGDSGRVLQWPSARHVA